MSGRATDVSGRTVWIVEQGGGDPLLYLHGFIDVHGWHPDFTEFHRALAAEHRVIAPAHPGCAETEEDEDIDTVADVAFHYLEVIDALGLDRFHLIGHSLGGWIAAELAVRHRERVRSLTLLGASGLYLPDRPIADIFWEVQPRDGVDYAGLRRLLFAAAEAPVARDLVPDGRAPLEQELLRYKMFRLASRIGFKPPYFYDRRLRGRLSRYPGPALVVWGADDGFVPLDHGRAYAEGLGQAGLEVLAGAGHSLIAERPAETARLVRAHLAAAA